MPRVPLPFRGVAVLLLAASAAAAQSPEPPAELFSLDSFSSSAPDFLRQFSADPRHPLLALMVDGELTSFEAEQAKDSAKPKLTPQPAAAAPKTEACDGVVVDGCPGDGCSLDMACPMAPNMLPFACPPPCNCRKCQRKHGHNRCSGHGCGNPYLNWPTCPVCFYGAPLEPCQGRCGRRCGHKHCGGCGNGYDGWGMGCDGWGMDGGYFGCGMACGQSQSCGHKRHSRHNRGCGNSGYGCPYYGGGWGMDGCFGGCWMPPPQQSCGHKSHRRHSCSNNYGYGYGCPGWGGYGCMAPYYACGYGCGGHHSRRSRHHGCQQPSYYPMMMPCMDTMPCMGMMSGTSMMSGMDFDSFGTDGMAAGDCDCGTSGTMLSGIFN